MATINYPGSLGYHRREGGTGANGLIELDAASGLSVKKGDPLVVTSGEADFITAATDHVWGIAAHDYPLTVVPGNYPKILVIPADRNNVFHVETAGSTDFTKAMIGTTRNFTGTTSGSVQLDISDAGTDFLIEGIMSGFEFGTANVRVFGRFVVSAYLGD